MSWQGNANVESPLNSDHNSLSYRKSIQSAIRLCDIYTFWKTECYTQALTAKILLKQKGIPSTVYIGFIKCEDGSYKGHAWLRSYDVIITGAAEKHLFHVHSFYS
jgi:Transglutaminase-like superfamily